MKFSGALMEGLCLSHDIVKTSKKQIFSKNGNIPNLNLYKLEYVNLSLFVCEFVRKITGNKNWKIRIKEFKFPNDSIYGMYLFRKESNEINIYVNSELNECWTRFSICKELIQIYLDCGVNSDKDKSYSPSEIIEQIKEATIDQHSLNSTDKNYEFSEGFSGEVLAYIVVTDLFFPLDNKKLIREIGKIIDLPNSNFTHYDLASLFKVPEHIAKFYRNSIEEASLAYLEAN